MSTLKITVRYAVEQSTELTLDEIRAMFGLGGMPDNEVTETLPLLLENSYPRRARLLERFPVSCGTILDVRLTGITDGNGDQCYPEV